MKLRLNEIEEDNKRRSIPSSICLGEVSRHTELMIYLFLLMWLITSRCNVFLIKSRGESTMNVHIELPLWKHQFSVAHRVMASMFLRLPAETEAHLFDVVNRVCEELSPVPYPLLHLAKCDCYQVVALFAVETGTKFLIRRSGGVTERFHLCGSVLAGWIFPFSPYVRGGLASVVFTGYTIDDKVFR